MPRALPGPAPRPPLPPVDDQRLQLVSRASAAERLSEIDPLLRVEAEVPHAVGGEAAPVAARTERFGRRRDDAEERAVGKRVAVGGRPGLPGHRLDLSI